MMLSWILSKVVRSLCVHDFIRVNEKNRMYLRCMNCQYETKGWIINDKQNNNVYLRRIRLRIAND
jgi:hypothetical protein